ncbi:MAG: sulfatase-like hydrolase/transferase, partial [Chitinophagales bacterium]
MKNIFALIVCIQATYCFAQSTEQPNIIMVILDDMNDWVEGLNGHPQTITPNIAELATQGTLFTKAYNTTPQCGPSRVSMLTGKHSMYTKIYRNTDQICGNFRANFTEANGNAEIFTLPEYLKDSVGYYTYGINKVYHCHENAPDYDALTTDPCAKNLSWNKHFYFDNAEVPPANTAGIMIKDGLPGFAFAAIPDSLETTMLDYRCIDSAITFINQYVTTDGGNACNKPLFMAVGLRRPHTPEFIPEHYFLEHYMYDFQEVPYDIPYNLPKNAYPANGVIMPPQPEIMWGDFYNLPEGGVARDLAIESGLHEEFLGYPEDRIDPFPEIDPTLTEEERLFILQESERANAVMAYLAAIRFSDAQIGRLYDALQAQPELLSNTILIVVSDNGYSLGEKMHWRKTALWETDNRVPLLIVDFRNPIAQVCNKTVSLLDIFPTIIDLIDAPAPQFSDGADYLDGKSMAPLLTNAQTVWERPSLATVRNSPFFDGSCFPQYSIRSDRFHYIEYTSNGLPGGLDCDSTLSEKQAELYDIGVNFETDPNEWNNLIDNAEYQPVVEYLQQWLPNGAMYLQKGYASEIQLKSVLPCLLDNDDIVKFKARVFFPEGGVVGGTALSALQLQWSNSLTGEIKFGANYTFKMNTIPPAVYAANDHVL